MALPVIQDSVWTNGGTAATSINVAMPVGPFTFGDLLLVTIANDDATTSVQFPNAPSGWTKIQEAGSATADAHTAAFYKQSDGTEGGTTVTFSATGAFDLAAYAIWITGARAAEPIISNIGNNLDIASTTAGNIPGITTAIADSLVLYCVAYDGGDTTQLNVSGTGWVQGGFDRTATGAGNLAMSWGYRTMVVPGVTGNAVISASVGDGMSGFMFAVNPVQAPAEIRAIFYDLTGTEYANGTGVYCYDSATGALLFDGSVGTVTGIGSEFPAAPAPGEVVFTLASGSTNPVFLVVKPDVDAFGLITNSIIPTQL